MIHSFIKTKSMGMVLKKKKYAKGFVNKLKKCVDVERSFDDLIICRHEFLGFRPRTDARTLVTFEMWVSGLRGAPAGRKNVKSVPKSPV